MILATESQMREMSKDILDYMRNHDDMKDCDVGEWMAILAGALFTLGYFRGIQEVAKDEPKG